jgi:DNA anti-recombination protein RmuC
MYWKLSLEREVDQMVNDTMQKEGWTRSYALSVLRSKFESEGRHQEVEYVNDLIQKEAQEQESELPPTTITEAEEVVRTNEPGATITISTSEASKLTHQKERQETVPSKSISKQLDKHTIQINKKITQILRPIQKQSQLIKQLQSQIKQLQKQVSQIQKVVSIKKKKGR